MEKQTLIEMAIDQIKSDLNQGDATALEELLSFVPINRLSGFISEASGGFEWEEVQVHWCNARRWVVRGVYSFDEQGIVRNGMPYSDVLDDLDTQKEAIERAKFFAFDTSDGKPQRGKWVKVFTRCGKTKAIYDSRGRKPYDLYFRGRQPSYDECGR